MRQTGGFACGATSTRSSPFSAATLKASLTVTTPNVVPSSRIALISEAVISSFTRSLSESLVGGISHLHKSNDFSAVIEFITLI